ncbi:MAG: bifunctional homocysteine S-methyltransferase/methylenetetrahydrofolate reductase [Thermoguttaceae bacterium]
MSFKDALQAGVLVFDGPMGTELYRRHVFTNRSFTELNLSDPKLIRQVHLDYAHAGCDVLTTNTYGASRAILEKYGFGEKTVAINQAGVKIAREVATEVGAKQNRTIYVAGSIGPLVSTLYFSQEQLESLVAEQVDALLEEGVDVILFETISSRSWLETCTNVLANHPKIPYALSAAIVHGKETATGESLMQLFGMLPSIDNEPVALGLNCGNGPDGLLEAVEATLALSRLPLIVQPNAGLPKEFEGRRLYYCSPEYIATYAMRYVNLGVAAIGGCCGMTPEHIAEMVKMVKPLSRGRSVRSIFQTIASPEQVNNLEKPESEFAERSRLSWKLANQKWVQTVELTPPRGYDLSEILEKSRKLARHGIDAVNIPDGPRASSRISPLIVAQQILKEANIEPILHFCCRDKNLIGMQADLLACAASDVRNILFVTGDPPKLGLYPNATGVFDTDSIGMCALQRRLNRSIDLGGEELTQGTNAVIGVGLDPSALDQPREVRRFREKVESGASFAITQPVFDQEALLRFLDVLDLEFQGIPIPILAGVWPLTSFRNAQFMRNEVPGVVVPDSVMQRMETASLGTKEEQWYTGIAIAREAIERIRKVIAGVQISAPFGRIDLSLAVLE